MVRAILAGTKTQTRRVVNPQPPAECSIRTFVEESTDPRTDRSFAWYDQLPLSTRSHYDRCPFGHPGDRLWVRETFALVWPGEYAPENVRDHRVEYRADNGDKYPGGWPDDCGDDPDCGRWKPSIFMPRWASRITLEVTGVRVERLQGIGEDDAKAEGVTPDADCITNRCVRPHRDRFLDLWNEINGKRQGCTWQDNPWVWVLEFRRLP